MQDHATTFTKFHNYTSRI